MEFNKKLQQLRKQKGLTQEELAETLYVSRTAVSKWESGRGYPNIDSLKRIAILFSVTVDALLSSEELLTIAEDDSRQREKHLCDLVFGLLDIFTALFLFLPFFAQKTDGLIQEVSLWSLTAISLYLRMIYFIFVMCVTLLGIFTLALQNSRQDFWLENKHKISLLLNVGGVFLFIISLQPYAAIFLFAFFIIKASILIKKQ